MKMSKKLKYKPDNRPVNTSEIHKFQDGLIFDNLLRALHAWRYRL